MQSTLEAAAPDAAAFTAAAALQKVLPKLVALSLDAKQAHWNVTGDAFLALHELTDRIAGDARAWTDRVAERAVALGFAVDARPRTVAASAGQLPAGRLGSLEAVTELAEVIDRVAATTRTALDHTEGDPVAHDVLVAVLEGLDKYRWMLTAQRLIR
jgi:starvation-inducible DNA-binding protein